MSSLEYGVYPGFGEQARDNLSYSQAVRLGDRIEISGQGILPVFLMSLVLTTTPLLDLH